MERADVSNVMPDELRRYSKENYVVLQPNGKQEEKASPHQAADEESKDIQM